MDTNVEFDFNIWKNCIRQLRVEVSKVGGLFFSRGAENKPRLKKDPRETGSIFFFTKFTETPFQGFVHCLVEVHYQKIKYK